MRSKKYTKEGKRGKHYSKIDSITWLLASFFSGMIFMLVVLYNLWV